MPPHILGVDYWSPVSPVSALAAAPVSPFRPRPPPPFPRYDPYPGNACRGPKWVQCCRVTCGRALSYLQTSRAEEPHQLLLQGQHCGVSVCYPSVPLAGAVCGRVPVRVIGRLWPTPVHVKPFRACRSHQYSYIGQLEHLEERVLSYYM